jgi:PPE-repeat protein
MLQWLGLAVFLGAAAAQYHRLCHWLQVQWQGCTALARTLEEHTNLLV